MPKTSLQHKIAQMLIMGFDGLHFNEQSTMAQVLREYGLGGVILFDKNLQEPSKQKNIESPTQVQQLTRALQQYAKQTAQTSLFIAIDYEGGAVNRLNSAYGFPQTYTATAFAALNETQASQAAANMAKTLADLGINMNFAPVVDLNRNPDNPIIGKLARSFSADPAQVVKYAKLVAHAHYQQHILFTYKHFPGHGSSTADSHLGCADVTDTWNRAELLPYAELINFSDLPCPAIMVGHIVNKQLDPTGFPATLSHAMLTDLLRKEFHYQGLIIADDMQMRAITEYYGAEQAIIMALNAGVDILIFGNQLATPISPSDIIELIADNVASGNIAPELIEQSYQRIMQVKNWRQDDDAQYTTSW